MTATDFGCKKINETQKSPFSDANIKKKKTTSKEERYIYDPSIFHGQKHAFCNLVGLAKLASSKKLIMRIRKFLVGSEIDFKKLGSCFYVFLSALSLEIFNVKP